jgi:hypothetical protein
MSPDQDKMFQSHTFVAFLLFLATIISSVVAKKLGIEIPPTALEALAAGFIGYILNRTYKSTKLEAIAATSKATIAGLDANPLGQAGIAVAEQALSKLTDKVSTPVDRPAALDAKREGGFAGIRFALVLCLISTLASCAWWQKVEPKFVDCAQKTCVDALPSVITEVNGALNTPGFDWQTGLEQIATNRGFELVACALQVIVSSLESGGGGDGVGHPELNLTAGMPPSVKLIRAYSYMQEHPVTTKK